MANAHDLLMAQRAAMMGGKSLPYLRRVAWLMSDFSGQYIDIGIKASASTGVEVKAAINNLASEYGSFFGSRSAWNRNGFAFYKTANERFITVAYGDNGIPSLLKFESEDVTDGVQRVYSITPLSTSTTIAVGGTSKTFSKYTFETPSNLLLFAYYNNGTIIYSKSKVEYLKLWQDGNLMHELLPVLDISGRPCMYDQAPSDVPADDPSRFFYNQGTGEFTWGELET